MIRKIFYIFMIFGFFPVSSMAMSNNDSDISTKKGLDEYSINSMEVIEADWEKEASRKIMENAYKEEFTSDSLNITSIKSFCSVEFIDHLNNERNNIKKILESALESKYFTEYDNMLLKKFNKYVKACISPLTESEKILIERSYKKTVKNVFLPINSLNNDTDQNRNIFELVSFILIISPNSYNVKHNSKISNKNTKIIYEINRNVNLNRYSLKAGKADIFRLFLYIWEDNEGAACKNKIFFPSFLSSNAGSCLDSLLNPAPFVPNVPSKIKQSLQYEIIKNNSAFLLQKALGFKISYYGFFKYKIINYFKILNRSEKINYCIMPSPPAPLTSTRLSTGPVKWKGEGSIRRIFYVL